MVAVASSSRLLKVVADLLLADPTLSVPPLSSRIYRNLAPSNATYPLIVLDGVSGTDLNTANGEHVMQNAMFQLTVRAKGGTTTTVIEGISEDALACLVAVDRHEANGIYIARIRRIREVPRAPDVVSGQVYPQIVSELYAEVSPA